MAPLLSPKSVLLISTAFTSSYVLAIYAHPACRIKIQPPQSPSSSPPPAPSDTFTPPLNRNHPRIIKNRLLAASLSTVLSLASLPLILSSSQLTDTPLEPASAVKVALRLAGLTLPSSWKKAAVLMGVPLGLTATLFTGSLWCNWLGGQLPGCKGWSFREAFGGWQGVRNYIIGPLTEELVFRSCIIAVAALGGFTKKQIIFLSPLYFGIAHVHHAYETYVTGGRTRQALLQGVLGSTFHFAYTTVFGWYSAFLFMRTGSVLPPFLAHAFCNTMGLPNPARAAQWFPDRKISIWGSYAAGIAGFVYGFWRWTEPALYGGSIYWTR